MKNVCDFMGNELVGDPPEMWSSPEDYPVCKEEARFRHHSQLSDGTKFSTDYCNAHSSWRRKLNPVSIELLA